MSNTRRAATARKLALSRYGAEHGKDGTIKLLAEIRHRLSDPALRKIGREWSTFLKEQQQECGVINPQCGEDTALEVLMAVGMLLAEAEGE